MARAAGELTMGNSRSISFKSYRSDGFTLIELMITVAVIAILAAIAYPSYQEHVRKSRRAVAEACILEAAQFLERYYTVKLTYKDSGRNNWACPDVDGHYTLAMAVDARVYTITAEPATVSQNKDRCGKLTIDQKGVKRAEKGGSNISGCW